MDVRVGSHKKSWALKNWCFWIAVLEKTLESPLGSKEIKPVSCKGNQSWIFIGRTDAEAPILWPPDAKGWLIGKDPDAGKEWGGEEKGATEDKTVGWHHWLNGHEFEQAVGDSEGQGSLAWCSLWGRKQLDITDQQLSQATPKVLITDTTVTRSSRNHMTPGKGSPLRLSHTPPIQNNFPQKIPRSSLKLLITVPPKISQVWKLFGLLKTLLNPSSMDYFNPIAMLLTLSWDQTYEGIGIVMILDSQEHPGIIHIQGGWFLGRILKGPPLGSRVRREGQSLPR